MPTIKGAYPLNTTDTLTFQTPKSSFYLLKVKAKAKSEKQRDSTDDEDITIKIDTLAFPKPNTLSKLINSLLGKTPESEFINLNNTEFIHNTYPPDVVLNVLTPKESIFWGVRWLYHKAQSLPDLIKPYKRDWKIWEGAIRGYNANPLIVEAYIKGVFSIYEKGIDEKTFPKNPVLNAPEPYLDILKQINVDKNTKISYVSHTVYSGTGLILTDQNNVFVSWLPESELIYKNGVEVKSLGDVMDWWIFEDMDGDNYKELTTQFGIAGTAGVHPFYLYTYKNGEFTLLLKLIEARSKAEVIDLDNDGIKEIVYKYALSGSGNRERETLRWKDIWRIEDGKPVKVNNQFPNEYKELIPIYDEALTTQYNKDFYEFDYPVYRCLKEKAELNINGQFADAESCKEIYNNKYR